MRNQKHVHAARIALKGLAWIFAISLLIQIGLAGLALFQDSGYWSGHMGFARYIALLPVLMLIVSFIAKMPGSIRTQIAALLGMIVLIFLSAMLASKIGWLSALHPVIATLLFFRTMAVLRQTDERMKNE